MSTREKIHTAVKQMMRITEGRPFPLGATWDGQGVNFALFSAHATKVDRTFQFWSQVRGNAAIFTTF